MRYLITTKYANYGSWVLCGTCGKIPQTGDEVLGDGKKFACIRCGADFNKYGNERFEQTTVAIADLKNPLYPFPARTTLTEIWKNMELGEKAEFLEELHQYRYLLGDSYDKENI